MGISLQVLNDQAEPGKLEKLHKGGKLCRQSKTATLQRLQLQLVQLTEMAILPQSFAGKYSTKSLAVHKAEVSGAAESSPPNYSGSNK